MIRNFEINHPALKQFHDSLFADYLEESIPKYRRREIANLISLTENLVSLYEHGNEKDYLDFQWIVACEPLLPEEKKELLSNL